MGHYFTYLQQVVFLLHISGGWLFIGSLAFLFSQRSYFPGCQTPITFHYSNRIDFLRGTYDMATLMSLEKQLDVIFISRAVDMERVDEESVDYWVIMEVRRLLSVWLLKWKWYRRILLWDTIWSPCKKIEELKGACFFVFVDWLIIFTLTKGKFPLFPPMRPWVLNPYTHFAFL